MIKPSALLLAALLTSAAVAEVKPNPLFVSGAVLQQGQPVPVWGTAADGEQVTVSVAGQSASAVAQKGRWSVQLPNLPTGGPYVMTIQGSNRIELQDVLVGDVYLCGGQSNMEWPLTLTDHGKEAAAAASDPGMRLFRVLHTVADQPREEAVPEQSWQAVTPDSIQFFSAVAYYFGRDLRRTRGVPIGLIQSTWGGTVAEAWTSREALTADPSLRPLLDEQRRAEEAWGRKDPAVTVNPAGNPNFASRLFQGMINPLAPYAISGVIWYQGESNADRAQQYRTLFPTLIRDWRTHWNRPDLPFMFVQLAPFQQPAMQPGESHWAELREAQRLTALNTPGTAMVVITDHGDADIHPQVKLPVGERLALAARRLVYGENVASQGPRLAGADFGSGRVMLRFEETGGRLKCSGDRLSGFTLAGDDGVFHTASAVLLQPDRVDVFSREVPQPKRLRYGWDTYPVCNLSNAADLPASPFEVAPK